MSAALAIGVRALCAFSARHGDLDRRFHMTPSALEGQAGHRSVVARRGAGYQSEIRLQAEVDGLELRGRADGYDPVLSRLEEIKTFRGSFDDIKENQRALHRAQLRTYGYLFCQERLLQSIDLALCYVDISTDREIVETFHCSFIDLTAEVELLCNAFRGWREQELGHQARRNAALVKLQFPFQGFRPGQRDLAEAIYRTSLHSRSLLVEAATGLGKTIATLFPVLKAWPTKHFHKVFFLSARNTGRAPALAAFQSLFPDASGVRVLELVAKDKSCLYLDRECHGESCPLAKKFYDRMPAARQDAVGIFHWDSESVGQIAARHAVCPYYLATELVMWADVVVGDYNHYFDRRAMLFDTSVENDWTVAILVDEAHNLLHRGRAMYSASLSSAAVRDARSALPKSLKRSVHTFLSAFRKYAEVAPYQALANLPAELLESLQTLNKKIGEWQSEINAPLPVSIREIYFDAIRLQDLASRIGQHSFVEITTESTGPDFVATVALRNVYPAPFLRPRFERASVNILFSGTLQPFQFQKDVLGLPEPTRELSLASAFHSSQLHVRIASISMRYRRRTANVGRVAQLICDQFKARPGNYLVFAGGYDYLGQLFDAVRQAGPDIEICAQRKRMTGLEATGFLAQFTSRSQTVGFAVMGGMFSEGVDLPGDHLIGAFICTLGLPTINQSGQEMQQRMDRAFGDGFDYQFLFPAMQRVIQAAGRIIRGPEDRGTLYLIDDRFAQARIRRLLPDWWGLDRPEPGSAQRP